MRRSVRTATARVAGSPARIAVVRSSHSDANVKQIIRDAFLRLQTSAETQASSGQAVDAASSALSRSRSEGSLLLDRLKVVAQGEPSDTTESSASFRAYLSGSSTSYNDQNAQESSIESKFSLMPHALENNDSGLSGSSLHTRLRASRNAKLLAAAASDVQETDGSRGDGAVGQAHVSRPASAGRKGKKGSERDTREPKISESTRDNHRGKKRDTREETKGRSLRKKDRKAATESRQKTQQHGWKDDWGKDELAPPPANIRRSAPQKDESPTPQSLPPYTRRIEGLILSPSDGQPMLQDVEQPSESQPVANLAHGLDRVLFNPGVHWLQDPRSRVYNFTPYLQKLPNVQEFAFERLGAYVKSSKDDDLFALANTHQKRFSGSTSSLTGILSQIYFLISEDRRVDTSKLSQAFVNEPKTFTPGQRMPATLAFRHRDGVYAIDSHDPTDASEKNILTWMGTMLEKFLTMPTEKFNTYLRSSPNLTGAEPDLRREAYRYAKTSGSFVMRSQLDCHDPRLPGTGVFDIKTRAALPIRLDGLNYKENAGYLIRYLTGPLECFEKEYYDLIRSAFLKYSFQARIGDMDGVFVAYHNTARLFGFQYVPLEVMDEHLFGSRQAGERVFKKCISMLEVLAEEVVSCFPAKSVSCIAEKRPGDTALNIWIQPMESDVTLDQFDTPITQLVVTSASFSHDNRVNASEIVEKVDEDWSLHWSISRLALPKQAILENLQAAQERLFREYNLPSGLSVNEMTNIWANLNYGADPSMTDGVSSGTGSPSTTASNASDTDTRKLFRQPTSNIHKLRNLARKGQMDIDKWAELEKGISKVVWGQPDYFEPLALDIEPTADSSADFDLPSEAGVPAASPDTNLVDFSGVESNLASVQESAVGDADILAATLSKSTPAGVVDNSPTTTSIPEGGSCQSPSACDSQDIDAQVPAGTDTTEETAATMSIPPATSSERADAPTKTSQTQVSEHGALAPAIDVLQPGLQK